jgi:flagellar biosynthesis GTPase FlhF
MNKTTPSVLKIENGVPNPDDALRIFCEVVGVTLFRESESLPNIDQNNPLFLDFPGLGISEIDEWRNTNNVLDNLGVETRILVINGAYDKEIIYKSIRSARYVNASHIAITHFDEMSNSTKLWPIVFHSNLTPICVCNGQNVTGDFSTSVLNQFIAKTFPEELYSKGFSTYQRI